MADTAIPILEMKNVGKTYSQNGRAIEALRGANLSVRKGEFICLIGASGCGKSTLLRMAAGFEAATQGDNLMWGVPIAGPGPSRGCSRRPRCSAAAGLRNSFASCCRRHCRRSSLACG